MTRTGKLVARKAGQNHFNAKQSGTKRNGKRRAVLISLTAKVIRRFLPGT